MAADTKPTHSKPSLLRKGGIPLFIALNLSVALTACSSTGTTDAHSPLADTAEPPEAATPGAHPGNTLIVAPATYAITAAGLQLGPSDDKCDIPASLSEAIQDHLPSPYEFVVPAFSPDVAGAPLLKLEITDLLQNAGGLYGGPKIVQLRGELQQHGRAPMHFTAQRQMFIYFGLPRSTCGMVSNVTYALGADIARWLQGPTDGAKLGEW